jgi:hypothetical protein
MLDAVLTLTSTRYTAMAKKTKINLLLLPFSVIIKRIIFVRCKG